jgi:hypothetical protein
VALHCTPQLTMWVQIAGGRSTGARLAHQHLGAQTHLMLTSSSG